MHVSSWAQGGRPSDALLARRNRMDPLHLGKACTQEGKLPTIGGIELFRYGNSRHEELNVLRGVPALSRGLVAPQAGTSDTKKWHT